MKLHRFYVSDNVELTSNFWLHNNEILNQWNKVLRFRPGQKVILFDGIGEDRLYEIKELSTTEAHLAMTTELKRQIPAKEIYLLWSLLKKDKNDWVLQKCTELGVSHFVPILADRSEKTGFNIERAQKIIIEASEQCGRSDIPNVREPINIKTAITEFYKKIPLFVCEQASESIDTSLGRVAVLVGPEGGWSDNERKIFESNSIEHINLHDFTLRAETACVAVATKLLQ
ncbi:16S rRNA (uracil(1498)-N(3))-methyltransferase [Candidatus Saccharibacteria bacterium]|nr:16S rRNA (uracil(1498)-N(3))-methyltransferase [Candidatus Saccharibacteria bacterium]